MTTLACAGATAFNDARQLDPEDRSGNWSTGVAYSWQTSIYAGEKDRTDFMPTFVYTGERLFLDTTDFGWHAVDNERWQLDVFGSYFIQGYNDHTFFSATGEVRDEDDPLKGMERKNTFEGAVELTRKTSLGRFGVEFRHDVTGMHDGAELRLNWARVLRSGPWQIEPWAQYRYLSSEKADYYFGVREDEATAVRPVFEVGGSSAWAAGLAARYTAWRQHHFAANLSYQSFSGEILESPVIADTTVARIDLSYRYEFDDLRLPRRGDDFNFFSNNRNATMLRVAYGCTTATKFNAILRGEFNCDGGGGSRLLSVYSSRQLTETLFTLPIEGWLSAGLAYRDENGQQDNFLEGVLAYKALFRRFPWSQRVETRIGLGHGFSYAGSVPALEQQKAEEKNRRKSRLLHYLEFSLDVSTGDLLGVDSLRNLFFGFYVHHRSGIFANADIYDNVYGGTNVNALYFEWEFGS
ncbi:MAG: MipA/OmpV family protein [Halieaceae bacterium]|nr:MipA/OmpV family protein [Halieaceae bacterium]